MNLESSIKKASQIIRNGGLVAFPTETVYGLGANAFDNEACLKIYQAKGRPQNNPLIVHVASLEDAKNLAIFNEDAINLSALWPGPITMVLPIKSNNLAQSISANLDTIAIRIPAHEIATKLILESGVPIAAPSANKSGRLSPTSSKHVQLNFSDEDIFILESNEPTKYGLESTIIDLSTNTPIILRPGFITPELIHNIIGKVTSVADKTSKVKAPGMMHLHYAPKTQIRINATDLKNNEIGLNFGDSALKSPGALNLSIKGDLAEAASNLFDYLHILDHYAQKHSNKMIAVAPIPNESIGIAINDRLSRAAIATSDHFGMIKNNLE